MGSFYVFIRQCMSCCGLFVEEEEQRKDGLRTVLDNSISSDFNGRRVLVSRLPLPVTITEDVSKSLNEQITAETTESFHPHSLSLDSTAPVSCDANAANVAVGIESSENGYILAETDSSTYFLGSQETELVSQKVTSEWDLLTCCIVEIESDGVITSHLNSASLNQAEVTTRESLASHSVMIYHGDDYFKGKLIRPQNRNSESASKPVKTKKKKTQKSKKKIQGYCSSQKILLVGEGNFSFSACLARAFGSATNMVATSLNSEVYLQLYYKGAMDNIAELRRRGCEVLHDVDATSLADHSCIKGQSFDRIIFNFPHCGAFGPKKDARRKNRKLVRLFMENSSKMIEADGEIHIRHKTSKGFLQWDLKGLGSEAGLVLIEEAPVHFRELKGYETKYGFEGGKFSSDDNFDCYPCCNYKFALPQH